LTSEVDEMVERSQGPDARGTEDGPVVGSGVRTDLFDRPSDVRSEEGNRPRDRTQLVVIDDHDPPAAHETIEVHEVDEHAVETVMPVAARKVEGVSFGEEPRQDDVRFGRVVLDKLEDARVVEKLQRAVREAALLVRIDCQVARSGVAVCQQAVADEERRDAVSKADLDG